jgi:hypothetical protein
MEATPPTAAAVTDPVVAAVGNIASLSVEAAECSMDEDIEWEDSDSDSSSFGASLMGPLSFSSSSSSSSSSVSPLSLGSSAV